MADDTTVNFIAATFCGEEVDFSNANICAQVIGAPGIICGSAG